MPRTKRELALRYDLCVAPIWQDGMEELFKKHLIMPKQGDVIEIHCGTGSLALEIAQALAGKGEVLAIDSDEERLILAEAKASVVKLRNLQFELRRNDPEELGVRRFALAIGDATMLDREQAEGLLSELVWRAEQGGKVVLRLVTRGSFGEFFSLLWEALHDCTLVECGPGVEELIEGFPTVSEVEQLLQREGLSHVHAYSKKLSFQFSCAEEFFQFPLIEDYFLDDWLLILPTPEAADRVRRRLREIIEREASEQPFEFSIRTTILTGRKGPLPTSVDPELEQSAAVH